MIKADKKLQKVKKEMKEHEQFTREKNLEKAYKTNDQAKLRVAMQIEEIEKQKDKEEKFAERVKELNLKYERKLELKGEKFRLRFSDRERKYSIQKTLEEREKEKIILKHNLLKEKVAKLQSDRE